MAEIEKRGKSAVVNRFKKTVADVMTAAVTLVGVWAVTILAEPAMRAQDAAAPAAGTPAQPKVKDQGEYDALTAAQKENDPAKKLDLLKTWQDKYPDSEYKSQRMLAFMNAWSAVAAKTMQTTPTPDSLNAGKSAAQGMLDNLDKAFAAEAKPQAVSDADWKTARTQVEQQAHMTLGWVALQNKDFPGAEAEFKKSIESNDQNAQVSYWLGTAIASQKNLSRTPEALFQFARAISITGPGALSPEGKKTASDYLTRAYNGYHGEDAKGLEDLKAAAAANAMPPAGFTIKDVVTLEKEKAGGEEQYLAAHPDIKLWRDLKATLTAADGDDYFNKSMKGTVIPKKFNAKVVSWTPDTNPTEVKISIDDPQGDATIKYDKPLHAKLEAGQAITIEGFAESFSKDPFSITFSGAESHITGITAERAAPAHRAPVRRRRG